MRQIRMVLVWSLCAGFAAAQAQVSRPPARSGELAFRMLSGTPERTPAQTPAGQTGGSLKKPAVGVLLSAMIPGTGEMYAGSWIKGAVFLGVEVGLWVGYSHFSGEGQAREDEFHDYAHTYWSEPAYWVDLAGKIGLQGVTEQNYSDYLSQLREAESDLASYTHTLPETRTQQYYEMIGKYDQFKAGWQDFVEGGSALTELRKTYEHMRHQSNIEFKRASYCAMAVLANHVFSALDAAWTIRTVNRRVASSIRMGVENHVNTVQPTLTLHLQW